MTAAAAPLAARRPLLPDALLGVGLAALLNGALYLVAHAAGFFPDTVLAPANGQPIGLAAFVIASVVATTGGVLAYALLRRFTRRPARNFRLLAAAVLVPMAVPPFGVPTATPGAIAVLQLAHLVAAAALVWALTRGGDR